MLDVAAPALARDDDDVRRLLLARVGEAHRLATWILHDAVAAEDAVQQAALLAWERRRDLRRVETADAWFTRILVNVCRQELRRRGRRGPTRQIVEAGDLDDRTDLAYSEPAAATSRSMAERLADRDELGRAIVRLVADEQIVLGLRYGRDLTVPQIAAALGLPEGTVKSRLHYALEHLRAALHAERRAEETRR